MNAHSLKVVNDRIRMKQKLMEYKGGKCQICGYDKPFPTVYHFHHRDPKSKKFSINASTKGYEKLIAEADKCDLLCSNCHNELHDKQWQYARERAFEPNDRLVSVVKACLSCNLDFKQKRKEQVYCSKNCRDDARRK